jgi:hypothetical protein
VPATERKVYNPSRRLSEFGSPVLAEINGIVRIRSPRVWCSGRSDDAARDDRAEATAQSGQKLDRVFRESHTPWAITNPLILFEDEAAFIKHHADDLGVGT